MNTKQIVVLSVLALLSYGSARADNNPPNITESEMMRLPVWCKQTQGFHPGDLHGKPSPEARYWMGVMGRSFWHVHHHCWAMIRMMRAAVPGLGYWERHRHLSGAVADYGYVISNAEPDFMLLPEVHYRQGEAKLLLDELAPARAAFDMALKIKPDYWPPYVKWAELLETNKRPDLARKHIEEGLKVMPNEPMLLAQHKRLSGLSDRSAKPSEAAPKVSPGASAVRSGRTAPAALKADAPRGGTPTVTNAAVPRAAASGG